MIHAAGRRAFVARTGRGALAALGAGAFGAFGARAAAQPAPAGRATTRAQSASASVFPSRTVRVVTPFPAGSGPDASLRLVAEQLARQWHQPVVVDNRPGGNGFIAVAAFRQGAADGHDLIQLDSTHVTAHPSLFGHLPYDVQRDMAPLAMVLRTPFFVAVGPESPYRTLADLVAAARAQPGRISYGSWFNGSPGHLGGLLLEAQQQLRMLHVPFRDFGQLYAAVSTREVDWAMASVATAGALEKAGRLRFIALAAPRREALYPAVPATAEMPALRGFELSAWAGLFGPAAIAGAPQQRIAADIRRALAAPEVVQAYRTLGYEAPALTPPAFGALIERETADWARLIRSAGLRLD